MRILIVGKKRRKKKKNEVITDQKKNMPTTYKNIGKKGLLNTTPTIR